jgi:hypothetical protein
LENAGVKDLPLYQALLPDQTHIDGFVDTLRCDFGAMAERRNYATAQNLEIALLHFRHVSGIIQKGEDRLDGDDAQFLIRAAVLSYANLFEQLPKTIDRHRLRDGMRAVQAVVIVWAQAPEQRAANRKWLVLDMFGRARILLNEIWTADILASIEEHEAGWRHEQNTKIIDDLRRAANG